MYYYAANQKVPIELDEGHAAVDFSRVESASPSTRQWAEDQKSLPTLHDDIRLVECSDMPEDVVLRPTSGKGADAIALANSVYEKVRPSMAQANFLQIARIPELV